MRQTYAEKLQDPRWQKRREEILRRDDHECQGCHAFASEAPLHVHHRWYSGEPWDAPDDALITLCERCHELETWWEKHGRPRTERRRRERGEGPMVKGMDVPGRRPIPPKHYPSTPA